MKLSTTDNGHVWFLCPGCKAAKGDEGYVYMHHHQVPISGPNAWTMTGTFESPTLHPSLLTTLDHMAHADQPVPHHMTRMGDLDRYVCHCFVRDGKIQYLNDCTHPLAGQTVDMVEIK